jgi:hypothetical protein
LLFYALTFALFISGIFLASFRQYDVASGLLVMAAGLSSIFFREAMASAQNRINGVVGNPGGPVRPTLFLLWGIAVAIVGVAWLLN